jgi:hypothetical protein
LIDNQKLCQLLQVQLPTVSAAADKATASSFPQPVLSVTALAKQCPDCNLKFATKTTLNLHRLKAHVVALKQLPCPQCKQVSILHQRCHQCFVSHSAGTCHAAAGTVLQQSKIEALLRSQ